MDIQHRERERERDRAPTQTFKQEDFQKVVIWQSCKTNSEIALEAKVLDQQ